MKPVFFVMLILLSIVAFGQGSGPYAGSTGFVLSDGFPTGGQILKGSGSFTGTGTATYQGGGGGAPITVGGYAEYQWTWAGAGPAPAYVIITIQSSATWAGASNGTGNCADGLGDQMIPTSPAPGVITAGASSGWRYQVLPVWNNTVYFSISPTSTVNGGAAGWSVTAQLTDVHLSVRGAVSFDSGQHLNSLPGQYLVGAYSAPPFIISGPQWSPAFYQEDGSASLAANAIWGINNSSHNFNFTLATNQATITLLPLTPGALDLTCSAQIYDPGGSYNIGAVTDRAFVGVVAPTFSFNFSDFGTSTFEGNDPANPTALSSYNDNITGQNCCMECSYWVETPLAFISAESSGMFASCQLINFVDSVTLNTAVIDTESTNNQYWLDNMFPYPFPSGGPFRAGPSSDGGTVAPEMSQDSPSLQFPTQGNYIYTLSGSTSNFFHMLVVYDPPDGGAGTDWVTPIGGDWQWQCGANRPAGGGAWAPPVGNPAGGMRYTWANDLFIWQEVYSNTGN